MKLIRKLEMPNRIVQQKRVRPDHKFSKLNGKLDWPMRKPKKPYRIAKKELARPQDKFLTLIRKLK